jgi:hypothetical protein
MTNFMDLRVRTRTRGATSLEGGCGVLCERGGMIHSAWSERGREGEIETRYGETRDLLMMADGYETSAAQSTKIFLASLLLVGRSHSNHQILPHPITDHASLSYLQS